MGCPQPFRPLPPALPCWLLLCLCALPAGAEIAYSEQTRQAGLEWPHVGGGAHKRFILEAHGSGAAFFDYDGDGQVDLYLVNGATAETWRAGSGPGNVLLRNRGDATFENRTQGSGTGDGGWGAGAAVADVEGDGDADLYLSRYGPNALYRNEGGGRFAEVGAASGVAGAEFSASAAFFDYDLDGDVDLYVANYVVFDLGAALAAAEEPCIYLGGLRVFCGPQGMEGGPDRLYRNEGGGRFTEVTQHSGVGAANTYYGLGVVPFDCEGDGDTDLFVANDETPNVLWRNEGNGTFAEIGVEAGVAYNGDGEVEAGMGADAGDYDGDGDEDLFVTNFYGESNTLYRNEGEGRFADVTALAGLAAPSLAFLGWGTRFTDADGDGDLDLFAANGHVYPQVDEASAGGRYAQRNQLFENGGQGRFAEVEARGGLAVEKVSRGTAAADYDGDGDEDLLITNLDDVPTLLRNDGGRAARWLAVEVGIEGAVVRVRAGGREQVRAVRGASGYLGYNQPRLFFGLGEAALAERVEIVWPGGGRRVLEGVPAGHLLLFDRERGHRLVPLYKN